MAPAFLNAPTSSFFLVSTLMTGVLSTAQRSRSSAMCWNWSSAVRMRGAGTLLVVDAQRESHLLEKPGDGPRADTGAELAQFGGDLGGRTACPLQAADRVASRLVVHQRFDVGDDFRRFFSVRGRPPPAAPHPVDLDVALDELAPAGGDRRRVDAEQSGDAPVAAPPALERFESGEQTPLPLVEQAGEQHDRGAQLLRHQVGLWQGPHESGRGQQQAPRAQLVGLVRAVGRAVEELAGELVPRQSPVADELAQRVLGADREQVVQLVDEVSRRGVVDERLGGCDQGAGAGEVGPRRRTTGRARRSRRVRRGCSSRRDASSWSGRRGP